MEDIADAGIAEDGEDSECEYVDVEDIQCVEDAVDIEDADGVKGNEDSGGVVDDAADIATENEDADQAEDVAVDDIVEVLAEVLDEADVAVYPDAEAQVYAEIDYDFLETEDFGEEGFGDYDFDACEVVVEAAGNGIAEESVLSTDVFVV